MDQVRSQPGEIPWFGADRPLIKFLHGRRARRHGALQRCCKSGLNMGCLWDVLLRASYKGRTVLRECV